MSTNYKPTFSKRQRELDQKDRVNERAARREERKERAAQRAATGQVGPEIGEAPVYTGEPAMDLGPSSGGAPAAPVDQSRPRPGGNRLYVGNLSFQTAVEDVRALFTPIGTVTDVHMVTDRDTGRPRGFAFVTMGSAAEAQKAMRELNNQMVDGRPLRVNEAEERSGGGGRGRSGGGGGGRY